jgi:hypothetical protein
MHTAESLMPEPKPIEVEIDIGKLKKKSPGYWSNSGKTASSRR